MSKGGNALNWRRGFFRVWVSVSLGWMAIAVVIATLQLSEPFPFGRTFQYVSETLDEPWNIDWSKGHYERRKAPGKGNYPITFAVLEAPYVEAWDKRAAKNQILKVHFPDRTILFLPYDLTDDDIQLLTKEFVNQKLNRIFKGIFPWGGLIFGPPLAMFLMALMLFWIVKGFTMNSHRSS